MGRPPAIIIVTRHGARLDAADPQWHLTSPTPYDPPLTYGGWRQSQALGARIASIIHSREAAASSHPSKGTRGSSAASGNSEGEADRIVHRNHRGKRRKHKVVIHSSPYLRCTQTAIAISAGMAQYQGTTKANIHPSHGNHILHSGSPHIQTMDHGKSPHLAAILEPEVAEASRRKTKDKDVDPQPKAILRVDAFLGEWLSPEYFDKITPPPESKLMVAGAKADLLRQGEAVDVAHPSSKDSFSRGNFPGGWGSSTATNTKVQTARDESTPLNDMSSLDQNLPKLARANSHNTGLPAKSTNLNASGVRSSSGPPNAYVPPTPSHAVSPSQPIPRGYVAHARDACVKVDYQWDSLRPPLEWGDGGDHGEEWSSMHKRFRRGLQQMISWYRHHDPVALVRTLSEGLPETRDSDDPDEEDTDTVLVLVTHGAGCNALIGALTNQPVLLDVGTASLTLAVRKTIDYKRVASPTAPGFGLSPSRRRASALDSGLSDDYEVKIIASTEHLRAGSQFLPGHQLQRTSTLPVREKSPYRYERHHFGHAHHKSSAIISDDDSLGSGSGSTTPTRPRPTSPNAPSDKGGLWTKPDSPKFAARNDNEPIRMQSPQLDGVSDRSPGILPQRPRVGSFHDSTAAEDKRPSSASAQNADGHSIAPSGLWGAPPQALATERDTGAKRRWTLSQAS
ncbi:hypothetical protein ACLMJK_007395 [Lecanora helva]